jgi:hypothetical protein
LDSPKVLLHVLYSTWPDAPSDPPRLVVAETHPLPPTRGVSVYVSDRYRLDVSDECFQTSLLQTIEQLARLDYAQALRTHGAVILLCRPEWRLEPVAQTNRANRQSGASTPQPS